MGSNARDSSSTSLSYWVGTIVLNNQWNKDVLNQYIRDLLNAVSTHLLFTTEIALQVF